MKEHPRSPRLAGSKFVDANIADWDDFGLKRLVDCSNNVCTYLFRDRLHVDVFGRVPFVVY